MVQINRGPRCGDCRHWTALDSKFRGEGNCRAHPPQIYVRSGYDHASSAFPVIGFNNHCGEHTPSTNPQDER